MCRKILGSVDGKVGPIKERDIPGPKCGGLVRPQRSGACDLRHSGNDQNKEQSICERICRQPAKSRGGDVSPPPARMKGNEKERQEAEEMIQGQRQHERPPVKIMVGRRAIEDCHDRE